MSQRFLYRERILFVVSLPASSNRVNFVFNLDLKRAETALHAGRLEDASRILQSAFVKGHAKAQELTDQLIAALLDRSEKHLAAQHLPQARKDAELAKKLGGRQLRIASTLQRIDAEIFSGASEASDQRQQSATDRISLLVTAGRHEDAIAAFGDLKRPVSDIDAIRELVGPSAQHVLERARADLVLGNLDRCECALRMLEAAGLPGPSEQELKLLLERCYNVRGAVERSDYVEALRELKLLARKLPDATWVTEMIDSVQVCLDRVEGVKAGPFGLLQRARGTYPASNRKLVSVRSDESLLMKNHFGDSDFVPNGNAAAVRSVLQVDRLGSLLLVQGDLCSVGGATAKRCDVVLQTEGAKDPILICRDGEDYFASSRTAFFVNDLLAERHLLQHGDTIHVGKRGRLKYLRPVAASSTAILQISGSKMKRRDIRAIVLVDDAIMFGQSRGHFRLPSFKPAVILRAAMNSKGDFLIHQKGQTEHQLLRQDSSMQINDCQFALSSVYHSGSTI
jgi:hypothetical protein